MATQPVNVTGDDPLALAQGDHPRRAPAGSGGRHPASQGQQAGTCRARIAVRRGPGRGRDPPGSAAAGPRPVT
jgi:hypothetical protein